MTDRTVPRRVWRLAALVALLALVASGCFYGAAWNHRESSPDTRPWWCHSSGDGGHHVDPAYHGQVKGMLSWDDCLALSAQFDLTLEWAEQWPTLGDAEAAGFHRVVNYVAGMGTHHTVLGDFDATAGFDPDDPSFPGTRLDDVFEPHRPEFLMYAGNTADAELVGFAWFVRSGATTPPEGFPGGNDWWHRHERLCHTVNQWRVVGEDLTDAQCASRGGINVDYSDWWMAHAWIVDGWQTRADVFTNHHPCLLPGGPAPAGDPCWDEAMHGGHGGH